MSLGVNLPGDIFVFRNLFLYDIIAVRFGTPRNDWEKPLMITMERRIMNEIVGPAMGKALNRCIVK